MIKDILISVVRLLLLQFDENDTLLLMSFFSYLCIVGLNFLKLSLQAVKDRKQVSNQKKIK